ncbi:30S ribosomal protein S6e [Candidatus Bathyarchaeota archaeon]|nr:30S ribosomal protein S6e [Candidatus Bathyarchaeota archaeon]MBS7630557.1 30S ribosomal protein S6e [Candidatus Bathyarchaeota archaeon]
MPVLMVSDPKTGKTQKVEVDESRLSPLIGRRIGEVIDGTIANLPGKKLQLTGGCDKDGIPMRPDVHGGGKKYAILSGGVGYKPERKGERRRKILRGNTVTPETLFLNFKIVEAVEKADRLKVKKKN